MRMLLAILALGMGLTQAHAISRYNSIGMSCGEAQARVAGEGAVILRYPSARNPSLTLFDRYVRHDGFCALNEWATTDFVPTADTAQCPMLVCKPRNFNDFRH